LFGERLAEHEQLVAINFGDFAAALALRPSLASAVMRPVLSSPFPRHFPRGTKLFT
jgi:hypothetical protein